jgi:hypothetical protein
MIHLPLPRWLSLSRFCHLRFEAGQFLAGFGQFAASALTFK